MPLLISSRLGPYEILGLVGSGGMIAGGHAEAGADPSTKLRVDLSMSKVEASSSERAGGGAPAPV
ncbi:MAG: hypothetical protein A3H97_20490 [Acidobacteria bacterium RIFCSPLOWO2_02_FULL_65_29]|nr:MAG: hypothetical protein A3H97_20490 [Acidobacteria bacterium RIFCSPLOWO2_02_FULL_65_29]